MEGIVFVPGIFGSELFYNPDGGGAADQIWPPGPLDVFGYLETSLLSDPKRVSVGGVVDYVIGPCGKAYIDIETDLRDISNKVNNTAAGPYLAAPYDWRVNLFESMNAVESKIAAWVAQAAPTEITIVCHSMGGLVVRLLLESKYRTALAAQRPQWLNLTKRVLFACTPHLGAPEALVFALGLGGDVTLSADDVRTLSANPDFASAYQLLPSSSRSVLFNANGNAFIAYDSPDVAAALGLSPANLEASKLARSALDLAHKPDDIEYFFVYGTGQTTDEAVEVEGLALAGASVLSDDLGDGTVPCWSITEAASQHSPPIVTWNGPGEHLGLLSTNAFRQELYNYFGLGRAAPMLALAKPGVVVSTNKRHYKQGDTIQVLMVPDVPTESLVGKVALMRVGADGKLADTPTLEKPVTVQGGPIRQQSIAMIAPAVAGAYRVVFEGDDATHMSPPGGTGWFVITAQGDRPVRGLKPRARRRGA